MNLATREELIEQIGTDWMENAKQLGNIKLHPLGEQSYYQFLEASEDESDAKVRWMMMFQHIVISTVGLCIFTRNAFASMLMVQFRPRAIAPWLCLIQSCAGMICALFVMNAIYPTGPTCRQILWMITTCIRINDLCTSMTLLQKAYIARGQNRWLLVFIPISILGSILILYFTWTSPILLTPSSGGCVFIYPDFFPWLRFAAHAPLSFILTLIFISVSYRQYTLYGNKAWKRLTQEGIQVGLLMVVINLLCAFAVAFEVVGIYSLALIIVEW
jgi:hypothetical protein